jgi:hypothetical protein
VEQIMPQELYRSAERVFMVVDNGTVHRGQRSIDCSTGGPSFSWSICPSMPAG